MRHPEPTSFTGWHWTAEEWAEIEQLARRAILPNDSRNSRHLGAHRLKLIAGLATGARPPSFILSPSRSPF